MIKTEKFCCLSFSVLLYFDWTICAESIYAQFLLQTPVVFWLQGWWTKFHYTPDCISYAPLNCCWLRYGCASEKKKHWKKNRAAWIYSQPSFTSNWMTIVYFSCPASPFIPTCFTSWFESTSTDYLNGLVSLPGDGGTDDLHYGWDSDAWNGN